MKLALIESVRLGGSQVFGWKWRSQDGASESAHAYTYFYDCCEDARRAGYDWRFNGTVSGNATPASLAVPTRARASGRRTKR
jgi:hypothetical protein